jgi:hypothetical protein
MHSFTRRGFFGAFIVPLVLGPIVKVFSAPRGVQTFVALNLLVERPRLYGLHYFDGILYSPARDGYLGQSRDCVIVASDAPPDRRQHDAD